MLAAKKKWRLMAVIIFLVLGMGIWQCSRGSLVTSVLSTSGPLKGKTICLDPGHGGRDPGAVGGGLQEKDLNLDLAKKTAAFLRRQGANVMLTRTGDQQRAKHKLQGSFQLAELYQRSRLPQKTGAHIFISIHCNSEAKQIYLGPQTFFENGDRAGGRLARAIQKELIAVRPAKRRAVPGEYYLLRKIQAPSVIVEVGYLSHAEDVRLLASASFRTAVAEAIGRGVLAYFAK